MPALHLLVYPFGPRFGVTSTGGRVRFVAASDSLPDVRDSLTVWPDRDGGKRGRPADRSYR